ncbi:putative receptor-like serine threonine-protein kinase [Trifolium pratense]|uniref:non-specific serine/threonine protein kinase n=1 Tax=Trifolium pratense TaxID=57577 RepID=A0A2K3LTA3_TRIPR|nr:putative receptor-like serine threonine-protein kinase [Trifolium pratense]
MSESTATSNSLMSLKVLILAGIFLIIVIIIVLFIFLCFRSNRTSKKRKLLPKLHSSGTTPLVSKEIAVVKEIDLTRSTEQTRIQIFDDGDVVDEKKEAEIKVEIGGVRKGDVSGGGVHMEEDPNIGWGRWYSLKEVEMATRGFSEGNVIGEGGYGVVYRGVLQDSVVAVKNLHNNNSDQLSCPAGNPL